MLQPMPSTMPCGGPEQGHTSGKKAGRGIGSLRGLPPLRAVGRGNHGGENLAPRDDKWLF